jgi:hypothetical protein
MMKGYAKCTCERGDWMNYSYRFFVLCTAEKRGYDTMWKAYARLCVGAESAISNMIGGLSVQGYMGVP